MSGYPGRRTKLNRLQKVQRAGKRPTPGEPIGRRRVGRPRKNGAAAYAFAVRTPEKTIGSSRERGKENGIDSTEHTGRESDHGQKGWVLACIIVIGAGWGLCCMGIWRDRARIP